MKLQIRPYINGTLYSVLSLPSMRETAISMVNILNSFFIVFVLILSAFGTSDFGFIFQGYEDILREYILDQSHDERQLNFIIKQLQACKKFHFEFFTTSLSGELRLCNYQVILLCIKINCVLSLATPDGDDDVLTDGEDDDDDDEVS